MADERPAVYREDGVWVVRASSFGACSTRLARTAAGMPGADVPQTIRDAWEFGREAEPHIIKRLADETDWEPLRPGELRKWGKVDRTGQLALELKVAGRVTVRCHPDGVVRNRVTGELRVLEVKTRAEGGSDPEADHFYSWQFAIEAAVTGLPVLLIVAWKVPGVDEDGNADGSRVIRDGPLDVREIDTRWSKGQIKSRAIMLARMFDRAEAEGGFDGDCDQNDYPCPYYLLCGDKGGSGGRGADGYKPVEEGRVELLAELAEKYDAHAAVEKAARKAKGETKAELMDLLDEGKWRGGGWKVAVSVSQVPEKTTTTKAHTRRQVKVEREKDG